AAERLQEALQRAGDRAEPDEADGAAEEEEAVRVPRMAPALVAAPHRPVAGRDLAARGERQGERHLRNRRGEGRSGREHSNATLEALLVVELLRPGARDADDRPQRVCAADLAVTPVAADDRGCRGKRLAERLDRHGRIPAPGNARRLAEAAKIRGREDLLH